MTSPLRRRAAALLVATVVLLAGGARASAAEVGGVVVDAAGASATGGVWRLEGRPDARLLLENRNDSPVTVLLSVHGGSVVDGRAQLGDVTTAASLPASVVLAPGERRLVPLEVAAGAVGQVLFAVAEPEVGGAIRSRAAITGYFTEPVTSGGGLPLLPVIVAGSSAGLGLAAHSVRRRTRRPVAAAPLAVSPGRPRPLVARDR